ncbi:MAG: CapA family protein [Oscillospiraceae bacterium]|nr:CapA family protein [Oscillospiraceae bacterium]
MASEYELNRQRQLQRRQELKRKRQQKKLKNRRLAIIAVGVAALVGLCALVTSLTRHVSQPKPTEAATRPTEPKDAVLEPETVITLAFGGDINVTDKTASAGDYTALLKDTVPLFAGADSAAANFEGNLCGAPYGTNGTRAPQAMMEALAAAGMDMLQIANSCTINNGLLGLSQTVSGIRDAGMEPLGAYASQEEADKYKGFTLRSIGGVKVAFVAFTKGMDNLSLPTGSEDRVNLLYKDYTSTYQELDTDGIRSLLQAVEREQPDITVAMLHWGSEFNNQISQSQTEIVELMQEEGVDAIVGTHSHYVQKLEFDDREGTVVAYSLGDLLGDADKEGTAYSIVLQLEITKNNSNGTAKITDVNYVPVYTVVEESEDATTIRLLQIREAIAAYEANSINKVSDEIYTAMKTALSRIESRVNG